MRDTEHDREISDKQTGDAVKKTKVFLIIAILILAVLLCVLFIVIGRKNSSPEGNTEEISSENVPLTAYGKVSREELIEYMKPTVVRIEVKTSDGVGGDITMTGSGVIIAIQDNYIDIATASHVVEMTATPNVLFYDGTIAQGSVLAYGKESDVAFVRVDRNGMSVSENMVVAAKCADNDFYNGLLLESDVYMIGSVSVAAGNVEQGILKEKDKFVELFQNHMLICEGNVSGGMSGGGTFASDGKLIGIIVGTNGSDAVSVAITDVMAEYRSISQ